MNGFPIDDDFFSPVRNVTSDSDTSDDAESLSSIPDSNRAGTSTSFIKYKQVSEHNEIRSSKEKSEIESCYSEFNFPSKKPDTTNVCTPVSNRNSNNPKRDSKTLVSDFNKIKIKKEKVLKDNCGKKDSSDDPQKKKEDQQRKSAGDCDAAKSSTRQNQGKKSSSRPTSLSLPKKEVFKFSTTKDIKKEKNASQSKNIYSLDMQKSNAKHSEKRFTEKSLDASIKKSEDSGGKSTDTNSCNSLVYGSSNRKSNTVDQFVESSKSTSPHSPFEISVEKIVRDLISSECDKIRQNMYAHQISFYRELNKVKEEMEREHLATTERMFKIMEQLMQVNFSLKSMHKI